MPGDLEIGLEGRMNFEVLPSRTLNVAVGKWAEIFIIRALLLSMVFAAGLSSIRGQDAPAEALPAASPAPSATEPPKTAPPAETDTAIAMDYLMNRKPQDGSVGKQAAEAGKRADQKAIAEDAVGIPREEDAKVRARFERYLGTAEVPQDTLNAYFSQMKEVSDLLRDNNLFEGWKQLHDISNYTIIDAGVSRELANRVEAIWLTGRATVSLDKRNEQLKKDVKAANANADLMSDSVLQRDIDYQRRMNQGAPKQQRWKQPPQNLPNGGVPQMPQPDEDSSSPHSVAGLEGKLQLTEEYLRSLELKAKIKLNELKQEKLLEQAKADFSQYITTLYESGRLNHVVLAADFYRKIFQEGEYPAEMAKQVNASLEINRDVTSSVDVFRYKVDRGQLAGATDSLQQAFLISELNPSVLGLPRALKEKVADFNAQIDQMRNLIEARDFGNLEALLQSLKKSATDFDTTKPLAIVNAVKLESKMRLGKAKLAAQRGDLKLAMEEFQSAAEAWPGNPDLEDKALTFFDTQDVKSQTLAEFDRMAAEQNFRGIFEKQVAFAPAIQGDKKREEALKTALETIKEAEMASEKANAMMINGDFSGAWETIELAAAHFPDDRKLNKLRADLSGRSAEFVSAINKAREAENRQELGFSLTWYVNAQRQYPASRIANDAIKRLSGQLLDSENSQIPTAL